MEYSNGYTEQCKDSSEQFTTRVNGHAAHAAAHAWQATAHSQPTDHPWLIDYTVHALWQTPLSLCDGTRAWPQILSLSEQSRKATDSPLGASGESRADSGATGPVANLSHALGGTLRHRLRVAHPPRWVIVRTNVVGQPSCGGGSRCARRWSTRGQHVGTRRERSALARTISEGGAPCARR